MLSDEQIKKFQILYKRRFGTEISHEEARQKAMKIIRLIEIVYKPMTESEWEQVKQRRRKTGELTN